MISLDSRKGRIQLAHEYLHEARVAWASVPTMVNTITATQAVGLAHAVELTVKAAVLYGNETPSTDHRLETMLARVPLAVRLKERYVPLVRQAALIRQDGGYPRSPGFAELTACMDQSRWYELRSDGAEFTATIENVGRFLDGNAPRPAVWLGPEPRRTR